MEETQPTEPILKINIEFNPMTGAIKFGGHIDNTNICLQILCEVGHLILLRNAETAKKAMEATAAANKTFDSVKKNGQLEVLTPPAAN